MLTAENNQNVNWYKVSPKYNCNSDEICNYHIWKSGIPCIWLFLYVTHMHEVHAKSAWSPIWRGTIAKKMLVKKLVIPFNIYNFNWAFFCNLSLNFFEIVVYLEPFKDGDNNFKYLRRVLRNKNIKDILSVK
jgi:hypothetical protein